MILLASNIVVTSLSKGNYVKEKQHSQSFISLCLYQIDPMSTCCKENECFDEYDRVANGIKKALEDGYTLRDTVISQFSIWFNAKLSQDKLEEIIDRMSIPS